MKALSLKQPWAWLICAGYKDIENRNWRIGRKSQHGPYSSYHQANFTIELPMRIYIHASKSEPELQYLEKIERIILGNNVPPDVVMLNSKIFCPPNEYLEKVIGAVVKKEPINIMTLGAIIGEVDIVDCVTESKSPWFIGKCGFVLANPTLYKFPIPCRGRLGFFEPDIDFSNKLQNGYCTPLDPKNVNMGKGQKCGK